MSYTKLDVLEQLDGGRLFFQATIEGLKIKDDNSFKNCKNPFYDDKKPSLSIYKYEGKWRYKDYGDLDYDGDVFEFASKVFNLDLKNDFPLILKEMIRIVDDKTINSIHRREPSKGKKKKKSYIEPTKLSDQSTRNKYFSQFNISVNLLNEYGVYGIAEYHYLNTESLWSSVLSRHCTVAYIQDTFAKIYCPNPKSFRYIGDKPSDFVFGAGLRDDNVLIITGGEKDVLTLVSLGYYAVCLNSETSLNIPKEFLNNTCKEIEHFFVLYDLDETGQKSQARLIGKYPNFKPLYLPNSLTDKGGKDISDLVKFKLDYSFIDVQIDSCIESEQLDPLIELEEIILKSPKPLESEEPKKKSPPLNKTLPSRLYDLLPKKLQEASSFFDKDYEKDVFTLSSIAVISSMLPNLTGLYDHKTLGANLNLFVIAPPSSGKGVMSWAKYYANDIHLQFKESFRKEKEEFSKLDSPDKDSKPIPKLHFIPANSSSAAVCHNLMWSNARGIIFETEADTLSNSLANDWGNYSDILRKVFHHETISSLRKTNNEYIEIERPHLSMVISGTPNQVRGLIPSANDGLFSRFLFYSFKGELKWRNPFQVHQEDTMENYFSNCSSEFLNLYNYLLDNDVKFKFNTSQELECCDFFTQLFNNCHEENGEDSLSITKRLGIIHFRISMILSTVKSWFSGTISKELICDDESFKSALIIVETLSVHSIDIYKSLPSNKGLSKIKGKKQVYFDALPVSFNRTIAMQVANTVALKEKTAEYYLKSFVDEQLINKPEHNSYKKESI
jgi:hypothetical protein